MESLYAKLYDKYQKLKKQKLAEIDDINSDQEKKFLNYVSASEELIQHLRIENEKLFAEVSDLKNQVSSRRSSEDGECAKYQTLLLEEYEKNKLLSQEIEKLQKLYIDRQQKDSGNVTAENVSSNSGRRSTRKRRRSSLAQTEVTVTPDWRNQDSSPVTKSAKDLSNGAFSLVSLLRDQQTTCCKASASANESVTAACPFQALMECLVGMEISTANLAEAPCISAVHQSSGYSFSLTWMSKSDGKEPEFLYRVSSLGTLERIAPEWMREVIMFSTNMCPIFFERIARLIK